MIYVYQILKHIRISKGFKQNAIASRIKLSDRAFSMIENKFVRIPEPTLRAWIVELEIPKLEVDWYVQKHKREVAYDALKESLPQIPKPVLQPLADLIALSNKINNNELSASILKHTLPLILPRPRTADAAMDEIHDNG